MIAMLRGILDTVADGSAIIDVGGVGYVVHDGELNNPFASGDPQAQVFSADHVLLGSRDNALYVTGTVINSDGGIGYRK